ncbi:MAG: hypothetical protein K6B74_02875, partial [Ruminococcus sp.]|nr:hypothetical protein [Ruminococcus sp.]
YIGGKKVCGILTESSIIGEKTAWAVVGIGVNITEPQSGFPAEIKDRAAALFPSDGVLPPLFRERFAAELLCTFEKQTALSWENTLDEYRRRSYLTGKRICLSDGRSATAVGISESGGLVAELSDGGKIVIESQFSVKEIDQQ